MKRLPPRSTRTDTLFPYTTLFRSQRVEAGHGSTGLHGGHQSLRTRPQYRPSMAKSEPGCTTIGASSGLRGSRRICALVCSKRLIVTTPSILATTTYPLLHSPVRGTSTRPPYATPTSQDSLVG